MFACNEKRRRKMKIKYVLTALTALVLICSCASTEKTSAPGQTSSTPQATIPAGPVVNEEEIVEKLHDADTETAVVTGVTDSYAVLSCNFTAPLYSGMKIRAEDTEQTVYAVSSPETFARDGSYIIFNDDGAYLKLEGASLEEGDTLSISSVTENAWNSSSIALDGPEKVLTLNGGSVRKDFICVYRNADGNVLREYGIASVINLTDNTEDEASYASLLHFTATSADQYKDALLFMLDNPGPYLFICDDQESFSIPLLVSMLMGARLEQIRNDYLASFGFTADSDEGQAVMNDINLMLEAMNGGTLPNDSQLLSLSIDYLNLRLGLSFTEIPLLRLSLR